MNIVDIFTKGKEKLRAPEGVDKCKYCDLRVGNSCRIPRTIGCPAGNSKYFKTFKLLGSLEGFLSKTRREDKSMEKLVWEWTERMIKEGPGEGYLKYCLEAMSDYLGSPEWADIKETILRMGPDHYQLGLDRDQVYDIFETWWRLVKYQYNLRYNNDNVK